MMVHNQLMRINLYHLVLVIFLALATGSPAMAQDDEQAGDADGSSEQVESRDEAYRRQMELEDARRQDPGFVDPVDAYQKDPEKIDKLPEESRDNIRDQLIDVIVENGDWEPSDALEDYPYQATEAAENDPVLKEQEQEAWDEQIDKYHKREAAAFGSHRGPVPGPGNPTGQQGGSQGNSDSQQGQGQQGGQQGQGDGQGSSGSGDGQGSPGSAGTYQPGANGSDDAASTAGVSESALDFLKGRQGQQAQSQAGQSAPAGSPAQNQAEQSAQAGSQAQSQAGQSEQAGSQAPPQGAESQAGEEQAQTAGAEQSAAEWAQQAQNQQSAEQSPEQQAAEPPAEQQQSEQAESEQQSEQAQDASPEVELETRGIIAIKDLDKLEGADQAEEPVDQEEQ